MNEKTKARRAGSHKQPQEDTRCLAYENLCGDERAPHRLHDGLDKAICVYPDEHYVHWCTTLSTLDFQHGAFGENFTSHVFLESEACIGDIHSVGETLVQLLQPR